MAGAAIPESPDNLQGCDVYRVIYAAASRYFRLFQLRSVANVSCWIRSLGHHSWRLSFRGYQILALDNRANRTRAQVMSPSQWDQINDALAACDAGHLLVLAGCPWSIATSPSPRRRWMPPLGGGADRRSQGSLAGQGSSGRAGPAHHAAAGQCQLRRQQDAGCKTLILSGDVHVGCLG